MKSPELFKKNLEAIRQINGQSLGEFADEAGISKSTMQSVCKSGNTTLDTAIRVSENLGLSLDSLTGDGQLAEKLDAARCLLRTVDWFRTLSAGQQEDVLRHFRAILEVIGK